MGILAVTIGVILFAVPTAIIGFKQAQLAHDIGYYFARTREALMPVMGWIKIRIIPDSMMIIGGGLILIDLVKKIYLSKKTTY